MKLWIGMRFDDAKGTPSQTMEMSEWGLKGIVHRSKSSGPGKKVALLPFYVNKDAWISEKSWLAVGWKTAVTVVLGGRKRRVIGVLWTEHSERATIRTWA